MPPITEYGEAILNGNLNAERRLALQALKRNEYRQAGEKLIRVLCAIDDIMAHSRVPARDWQQISLALGLPSARYLQLTEISIGRRYGITTMAVSKCVTRVLRLAELKPNGRGFNGTNHER